MFASALILRPDVYILLGVVLVLYIVGMITNKLPTTGAIHDLVAMVDSKGGNIIILFFLAMYFFHRTEQMYYGVMALVNTGKIASDNGVALNGLLFCTGAFGSVSGALLKVMTGTELPPQNGKVVTTVTNVTESASSAEPKV
jgi:hypothetical protein